MLDWIGDVGGLNEGLMIIFGLFLSLSNFNAYQHHLVEKLYKTREKSVPNNGDEGNDDGESGSKKPPIKKLVELNNRKTSYLRQKFDDWLPRMCKKALFCSSKCHLSREERLFAKARD